MDDLKDRLGRLSERAMAEPESFEHLLAYRARRVRRRRVAAGGLALVLAAASSLIVLTAFRERTAVIPITSPQPTPVPDVAVVVCDGQSLTVEVGTVVARPDGVHVEVINTSDRTLAFNASDTDEFHDVPPGSSTFVESFFFSPGPHFVACGPGGRPAGTFEQQIHVLDPNDVWVPPDLACPGSEQWGSDVSASDPDPILLARKALGERIHAGDALGFAGYPDSPSRRVVVLSRDGEPIAEVWMKAAEGGWVGYLMNGCP